MQNVLIRENEKTQKKNKNYPCAILCIAYLCTFLPSIHAHHIHRMRSAQHLKNICMPILLVLSIFLGIEYLFSCMNAICSQRTGRCFIHFAPASIFHFFLIHFFFWWTFYSGRRWHPGRSIDLYSFIPCSCTTFNVICHTNRRQLHAVEFCLARWQEFVWNDPICCCCCYLAWTDFICSLCTAESVDVMLEFLSNTVEFNQLRKYSWSSKTSLSCLSRGE